MIAVASFAVSVAIALRLLASLGELWLDEIVSFNLAMAAQTVWGVFGFRVDNNHLLNTILMHLMGNQSWWPVYRLPAVLAGVGTVILGGMVGQRWGSATALVIMLLLAVSYPMVHYGSEARGYSLAAFFSMLALWWLLRSQGNSRWFAPPVFWMIGTLGFVSHPLFLQATIGLAAWSTYSAGRTTHGLKEPLRQLVIWHAVPVMFFGVFYWWFLKGMNVTGGVPAPLVDVIGSAASLVLGAPSAPPLTVVFAIGGLAALPFGLWILWRRRDAVWIFFLITIVVAPALILIVRRPEFTYERYFLLSIMFMIVLLGLVIAEWIRGSRAVRAAAICVLACLLGLNAWHSSRLIQVGRGQYMEALRSIAAESGTAQISISSDHDFRHWFVVVFYSSRLPPATRIEYVKQDKVPPGGTDQYLAHVFDRSVQPASTIRDAFGNTYDLTDSYDYAGLSGWRLFVYRSRDARPR